MPTHHEPWADTELCRSRVRVPTGTSSSVRSTRLHRTTGCSATTCTLRAATRSIRPKLRCYGSSTGTWALTAASYHASGCTSRGWLSRRASHKIHGAHIGCIPCCIPWSNLPPHNHKQPTYILCLHLPFAGGGRGGVAHSGRLRIFAIATPAPGASAVAMARRSSCGAAADADAGTEGREGTAATDTTGAAGAADTAGAAG